MALALALAAIGWNQVGCCSRASPPVQFCSAYSSGENQSHDCCNVHCNLFDNNLSVTHCNILAKLPGEFIGVCQLPGRVLSVACGMYRYVFYVCRVLGTLLRMLTRGLRPNSIIFDPILYSSRSSWAKASFCIASCWARCFSSLLVLS